MVNVLVARCTRCGEYEVVIPNIEGLHRALALAIAGKEPRLSAEEIRFLRKYIGLSSGDFAQHIGVAPETVSRWENGKSPMSLTADRLLRMLVLTRQPVSHYPLEMFRDVATEDPRPFKVGMKVDQTGWHPTRELVLETV